MTNVLWPVNGYNRGPISQVQPFVYSDAVSYLDILYSLKSYITDDIVPVLNNLGEEVNTAIGEALESVESAINNVNEITDEKIADLQNEVNTAIQSIINNSIELQDPVMAGILGNETSDTRGVYNSLFSPMFESVLATNQSAADPAAFQLDNYTRLRVSDIPEFPLNAWYGYRLTARFGAAVQRVLDGSGIAKILCVGDSTTRGLGGNDSEVHDYGSYPAHLARYLHRSLAPTIWGLGIPSAQFHDSSDIRWVAGSGWEKSTIEGLGVGGKFAAWTAGAGTSGALTYLDTRISADAYDVYYTTSPFAASGTFTAQVGLGAPVEVNTRTASGSERAVGKVTVTGTGASTSTPVSIRNTGASGTIWIVGIEPHRSGQSRIRIGNAGVNGADSTSMLQKNSDSDGWNVIGLMNAYQPDLVIIDLGINERGQDPAGFSSRMRTLANAARSSGAAVMFKTMLPSNPAGNESQFAAELIGSEIATLNMFTHYGSWVRTNTRGFMADNVHGNDAGYRDVAERVSEFLIRYSGNHSS